MGKPTRLAEEHVRALDRLSKRPELAQFYLAEGTAIAAHLEHQQSLDLDFFSARPDVDLELPKRAARSVFGEVRVLRETDASVHLVCDGTPIDFVRYPYPLLEPPGPGRAVSLLLGSWISRS
jgi:hypothetical protein